MTRIPTHLIPNVPLPAAPIPVAPTALPTPVARRDPPLIKTPYLYRDWPTHPEDSVLVSVPGGRKEVSQRELDKAVGDVVRGYVLMRPGILAMVQLPPTLWPNEDQFVALAVVQFLLNLTRAEILGDSVSATQQLSLAWTPIRHARYINMRKFPNGIYHGMIQEYLSQFVSMAFMPSEPYLARKREIITHREKNPPKAPSK